MSSSHQKDQQIDFTLVSEKLLFCPDCGKRTMQRVSGACVLEDGIIMPELEREHCHSCGADLFDLPAMKAIREFRESTKRKPQETVLADI